MGTRILVLEQVSHREGSLLSSFSPPVHDVYGAISNLITSEHLAVFSSPQRERESETRDNNVTHNCVHWERASIIPAFDGGPQSSDQISSSPYTRRERERCSERRYIHTMSILNEKLFLSSSLSIFVSDHKSIYISSRRLPLFLAQLIAPVLLVAGRYDMNDVDQREGLYLSCVVIYFPLSLSYSFFFLSPWSSGPETPSRFLSTPLLRGRPRRQRMSSYWFLPLEWES